MEVDEIHEPSMNWQVKYLTAEIKAETLRAWSLSALQACAPICGASDTYGQNNGRALVLRRIPCTSGCDRAFWTTKHASFIGSTLE